jgi:hypothetical protein
MCPEILEASVKKNKFEMRVLPKIRAPAPGNRRFIAYALTDLLLLFARANPISATLWQHQFAVNLQNSIGGAIDICRRGGPVRYRYSHDRLLTPQAAAGPAGTFLFYGVNDCERKSQTSPPVPVSGHKAFIVGQQASLS